MKKRVFIVIGFLFVLLPLGLLSSSPAWGEWENEYYKELLGFIPKGIVEANVLQTPMPDYTLEGLSSTTSYYLSALVGMGLLFGIYFLLLKVVKHEKSH